MVDADDIPKEIVIIISIISSYLSHCIPIFCIQFRYTNWPLFTFSIVYRSPNEFTEAGKK